MNSSILRLSSRESARVVVRSRRRVLLLYSFACLLIQLATSSTLVLCRFHCCEPPQVEYQSALNFIVRPGVVLNRFTSAAPFPRLWIFGQDQERRNFKLSLMELYNKSSQLFNNFKNSSWYLVINFVLNRMKNLDIKIKWINLPPPICSFRRSFLNRLGGVEFRGWSSAACDKESVQ